VTKTRIIIAASAFALFAAAPANATFWGGSSGGWWGGSSGGQCKKNCGGSTGGNTSTSTGGNTSTSTGGNTSTGGSTGGTAVPEPADFALFAAGVAGLVIGRRSSRKRNRD